MSKSKIFWLAVFGLMVIYTLLWVFSKEKIEHDLISKVEQSFNKQGINWAAVSSIGRDMTLKGSATSQSSVDQALTLADQADDVRVVSFEGDILPPRPASINIKVDGSSIMLAGEVLSQANKDALLSGVDRVFPGANVTNNINVSDEVGKAVWVSQVNESLTKLVDVENVQASVIDGKFVVAGLLHSNREHNTLKNNLLLTLDRSELTFDDQITLDLYPLSSMKATRVWDQVVLEGMVADQRTLDKINESATSHFGVGGFNNQIGVAQVTQAEWLDGALDMLPSFNRRGISSLKVNESTVDVTATVASEAERSKLIENIMSWFGKDRKLNESLAWTTPELANCQYKFNQLLQANKIEFSSGSATLSSSSFQILDSLYDVAQTCPSAKINVGGHTDDSGNSQQNTWLSIKRARQVANYLLDKGLAPTQFSIIGFGERRPIASNETDTGRARNRRIEFTIKN